MVKTIKIWDPLVRAIHWTLVVCVISNFALKEGGDALHHWLGYIAAGAVILRVLWGFVGTRHARFADFFPTSSRLVPYLNALVRRQEPRMLGHNPAAAVMMLTLMALVLALGVTGFLLGTDTFWGDDLMKGIHEWTANVLIGLVGLHALAAVVESIRHRENLVWSMITGKKRE
ncbi:MAG TPA: cytochrome B [Polaromonas sp.]|nr:cytochrome B [Polaromonas sp.]